MEEEPADTDTADEGAQDFADLPDEPPQEAAAESAAAQNDERSAAVTMATDVVAMAGGAEAIREHDQQAKGGHAESRAGMQRRCLKGCGKRCWP